MLAVTSLLLSTSYSLPILPLVFLFSTFDLSFLAWVLLATSSMQLQLRRGHGQNGACEDSILCCLS